MIVYKITINKEKEYAKTNLKILLLYLNRKTPMKNIGKIYHNLDINNLKDTSGIEDVQQVTNIQKRYNNTHVVIGCFIVLLNNENL